MIKIIHKNMNDAYEKFNITIEELLGELAHIFDNLHKEGLIEENGSFIEVLALALQQFQGEELIKSYCDNHEFWSDCYKRDIQFLLKDFSLLFDVGFSFDKIQVPARIYIETEGKNPAITSEDIEIIFDYLIALSKHACNYVEKKRASESNYLPDFPLGVYNKNFAL